MKHIQCFFLSPQPKSELYLRRYRSSNEATCSGKMGYCSSGVALERFDRESNYSPIVTDEMKADPRWPAKCEHCGYVYQPEDMWQWQERQLYERSDTKELIALESASVGAMWDAHWLDGSSRIKKNPDGIILSVRTPGGDWCVDGGSSNGNGWERSGVAPMVTATPSIICGDYHGWLRKGVLEEC